MEGLTLVLDEICTIDGFPAKHAITTVNFGDCGFHLSPVDENFQLARLMNFAGAKSCTRVVPEHKDNICLVTHLQEHKLTRFKCDALIAFKLIDDFKPLLASNTADCPTIFLADKNLKMAGIIHSGWRGTRLNIAAKTINRIFEFSEMANSNECRIDIKLENLIAGVWPGICGNCYEVKQNFKEYFPGYYKPGENGQGYISLNNVIIDQLLDCGLDPDNIFEVKACSFCSCDPHKKPLFHSNRRDKNGHRNVAVISI